MRRLGSWTIIFRGNIYRNILNMFKVLGYWLSIFPRMMWQMMRYLLRFILAIIGINWFELERVIERKVRVYIT